MRSLDLDAVQAFVLVADHGSFTRAADALGATQSGISLRLKRLEDRLGARLFERTPRLVRLTPQGEAFLPRARRLLEAQDDAIAAVSAGPQRLVLGISDHVAGPELPGLLARVAGQGPGLALEVRLDLSQDLLAEYDAGALDAVIVRRDAGRRDGEALFRDEFGWFAVDRLAPPSGRPAAAGHPGGALRRADGGAARARRRRHRLGRGLRRRRQLRGGGGDHGGTRRVAAGPPDGAARDRRYRAAARPAGPGPESR